jgi:hypothetical protein
MHVLQAVATAALFLATKLHNYNKTIHDVCRCSLFFRMGIDPGYKHKHHLLHDRVSPCWLQAGHYMTARQPA